MAPKKKMLRARTTRVRRVLALRVGGRIYSTALTPDRKAGGYTVRRGSPRRCIGTWSGKPDSNRRPSAWERTSRGVHLVSPLRKGW